MYAHIYALNIYQVLNAAEQKPSSTTSLPAHTIHKCFTHCYTLHTYTMQSCRNFSKASSVFFFKDLVFCDVIIISPSFVTLPWFKILSLPRPYSGLCVGSNPMPSSEQNGGKEQSEESRKYGGVRQAVGE